ncbi:PREDICTED: high affinity copper uptake protein 1-like isoform X1 [Branchiostoma belcheri]|uniref:Copper transport protein n=1 Tax=Branchiostoma belcheri TaxID=7741 RepID=A0A6P4XRW1_BRABE|nr:PREDICTED: high affinity copper uptake protein 1-like isoform X1 [Branchiostoma belcheri]
MSAPARLWLVLVCCVAGAAAQDHRMRHQHGAMNQSAPATMPPIHGMDHSASMDHGAMDHSNMDHGAMDHSNMDHSAMDHSNMDHSSMDHSSMDHSTMDHSNTDHSAMDHSNTDHSNMDHSTMDHDSMGHSNMNHSTVDHSTMDHSNMDHSNMDHSSMVNANSGSHSEHGLGGMMMPMSFYFGYRGVVVLFAGWVINDIGTLIGSMVGICIIAALYEGLKVFREHLLRKSMVTVSYHSVAVPGPENLPVVETQKTTGSRILSSAHLTQTLLHVLQIVVSYFLMLVFMTYNGWLCIAVAIGAGIGYFAFGWKRAIVIDINEHCH